MTIRDAKKWAIAELRRTDTKAAIDAEIILAHSLGITREEALAHDERIIPRSTLSRSRRLIARRKKHEPTAYLIGHREFFGLKFAVNKHVLIPRPETELLVEEILDTLRQAQGDKINAHDGKVVTVSKSNRDNLVIDVGTGSGAIAIAVAKNSDATVIATDISKQALKVAQRNASMNNVEDRIDFQHGDLLGNLTRPLHFPHSMIIAANLPYIPTKDWRKCMPDVKKFEPRGALDGGPDGLRLYDKLFHQIVALGMNPAAVICEIDPSQKKSFPKLAKKHFPDAIAEIKNDLAKRPRIGIMTWPKN